MAAWHSSRVPALHQRTRTSRRTPWQYCSQGTRALVGTPTDTTRPHLHTTTCQHWTCTRFPVAQTSRRSWDWRLTRCWCWLAWSQTRCFRLIMWKSGVSRCSSPLCAATAPPQCSTRRVSGCTHSPQRHTAPCMHSLPPWRRRQPTARACSS